MAVCGGCEKGFSAKRSDAKYCSATCRQRGRRKRLAAAAEAKKNTLTLDDRALLDRLALFLPVTAPHLEDFILQTGAECAGPAIKLVQMAYLEVVGVAS